MKTTLKTALTAMALLFSAGSMAADSTKAIQLQWQGLVPTTPTATGDWKFVDPITGADYVPIMGVLNIAGGDIKTVTPSPVQIGLKANTGVFTASSNIKAYLATPPTYIGLTGSTPPSAHKITVNGKELGVGSSGAIDVASVGTPTAADIIPLTITGSGQLELASYTPGDTVILTANLMVTADVT